MKKYKLTKVTKEWLGVTLYQIEALRSFGAVSKGEKGGYISKEDNLSQDGDAWVSGELKLIGGSFYHTKEKSETIEKIEVSEDYEILARDPKLAEEDEESSLSGKEVTVTLDGKSYTAVIK